MLDKQRIEWMKQNMHMCPVNNTFRMIGKKFTVLIIRDMVHLGHSRFNEFLEIEDINAKILSARLKEMEKDGLVRREVFHETPVRIEYTITEKGRALQPILDQMAEFSVQYCANDVFKDGKARDLKEVYGREYFDPSLK